MCAVVSSIFADCNGFGTSVYVVIAAAVGLLIVGVLRP